MENEIKVGEYIRTKDGVIDKIVDIRDTYSGRKLIAFEKSNILKSDIGLKAMIVKHSPNLIDIIEEGDYVNGSIVVEILYGDSVIVENYGEEQLFENDIKSIVTKERFESVSYKVKE